MEVLRLSVSLGTATTEGTVFRKEKRRRNISLYSDEQPNHRVNIVVPKQRLLR